MAVFQFLTNTPHSSVRFFMFGIGPIMLESIFLDKSVRIALVSHNFVAIALINLDTSSLDTGLNDYILGTSLFSGEYLS